MGRYNLRILLRPSDGTGPAEIRTIPIAGDTVDHAIAQAVAIVEGAFSGRRGIALLTEEGGGLIWSLRKDMPRPGKPGTGR